MEYLLAFEDSVVSRLVVSAISCGVGVILILAGRNNIKTQTAEETGRRRKVNRLMGRSNTYTGETAVMMGKVRIVMGVCVILFGIVFVFTGPFLAR
jgi:hypothetical protein